MVEPLAGMVADNWQIFFEWEGHKYYDEAGTFLSSVTQILKPAFILDSDLPEFENIIVLLPGKHGEEPTIIPKIAWRKAQRRGTLVHKTVELHEKGSLNYETLHPTLAGYLESWENAKRDLKIQVVASELLVASRKWWYAGRLDILAHVGRQSSALSLIDIKSGQKHLTDQAAAQTAAYKEAYNEHIVGKTGRITDRYTIWLGKDGKYQYEPQNDGNDLNVFLGLLNQQRWRK